MQNQKIEDELNLALDSNAEELNKAKNLKVGFDPQTKTWEVIVKYNGDILKVGEIFEAKTEILTDRYAIMTLEEDMIFALGMQPEVEFIEKPKSLALFLDQSLSEACITRVQKFPPFNLKGEGTLLAIIDSGIDYAHPDFINEDGTTRITYLWDQTIEGGSPEGFNEGTEYTSEQINEALSKPTAEERLKVVPSQDFLGHGTHVAGIAGGNGRASNGKYTGVAPKAEFIIVKLGLKGAESFARTTELMRAIKYVIEKSEQIGKPVAINISFGNNDGSHDGNSLFETYIDNFADRWENVIVVGSGNEGTRGRHTSGVLTSDSLEDVEFFIGPAEQNVYLQLWKSYVDDISLSLTAPDGKTTGFISPILGSQKFIINNTQVLLYYGEPSPFNKAQQIYIELIPASGDFLTSGIWKITLKSEDIVIGDYDIWLPAADQVGDSTVFAKPTTETTLTIPSTTSKVITVGAYNTQVDSLASFSGRGYTRETNIVKPDLVAPGENIISTVPGGGYDARSGTSMATPFVTGSAALMMEWGIVKDNDPFLYGQKIKAYLIRGAKRDEDLLEYPNPLWGYGQLCLYNSLKEAVTYMNRQEQDVTEPEFSSECERAIKSNDYADILVEYEGNIQNVINKYNAKCYQIINNQYAVLHYPVNQDDCCMTKYQNIPYDLIPTLFGLYTKSALEASGILGFHKQDFLNLTGSGVIVGIVDTGINYDHPAFVYEDNTSKILSMWDQTLSGNPPNEFLYGTEFSQEQINQALQSDNPLEIVPEVDKIGHGTFLAGAAAGREVPNADFVGTAPDADLIVVKLKQAKKCLREYFVIDESVPVYQNTDIMQGVHYLIKKAKEFNKPLVILIGLGTNEGAHDGTSILERYLADIGSQKGHVSVIAAGNEADKQHHHSGRFELEQKVKRIEVNVAEGEDGFTTSIWTYAPDKMAVAIASPGGEYIEKIPVRLDKRERVQLVLEETEIFVEYDISEVKTGDQVIFIRFTKPTAGIWTIELYGELIVDGRFHAWLPREGWIKPNTVFLQPDPYTTVTVPSTSIGVITVGAYNHLSNSLYIASGRGLTRDQELKPDLVAPGVNLLGPYPAGTFGTFTGTSVSAAITAGASALMLQWGILNENDTDMNTLKVRNYLIRGAVRKRTLVYPNREWGYGELNLLNTFKAVRG